MLIASKYEEIYAHEIRDFVYINDNAYTGFDYKEQIFPRTLSNLIYANPQKIPILDKFQRVVFALIETVKEIKNYFNYTVPFNNRRVF